MTEYTYTVRIAVSDQEKPLTVFIESEAGPVATLQGYPDDSTAQTLGTAMLADVLEDMLKTPANSYLHPYKGVGYCPICKHYGQDCTGNRA